MIPTPPLTVIAPVVVFVEAVPDVTANPPTVNLLSPIVIPEPVKICVLPAAVFKETAAKYLVAVDAATLTSAADAAVPENVAAVIVFPRALTPDKTYTGVEPIEALLLEPVK